MTLEESGENRKATRTMIETLILITGLVMMPLVYLWQQTLTILDENMPAWYAYLTSQLGSNYTFEAVIASYLTPIALAIALPIDLMIWAYDGSFILSVIVVMIFGFALEAVEKHDVGRVEKLVKRGRTGLNVVLTSIIFFGIFHLLTTTLFPFRKLLEVSALGLWGDLWSVLLVALAGAIIVWKLVNRSINKTLGTDMLEKKPETPPEQDMGR